MPNVKLRFCLQKNSGSDGVKHWFCDYYYCFSTPFREKRLKLPLRRFSAETRSKFEVPMPTQTRWICMKMYSNCRDTKSNRWNYRQRSSNNAVKCLENVTKRGCKIRKPMRLILTVMLFYKCAFALFRINESVLN